MVRVENWDRKNGVSGARTSEWKQSPLIVRSIYGKYPLNPQKIATKGFSTAFGRF